jgi:hypothetical protein
MMFDKRFLFSLFFFAFTTFVANAQDLNFDENIRKLIESGGKSDSINQRTDAEVQSNRPTYRTRSTATNRSSRRIETSHMSEEALYWSRYAAYSMNVFGPDVTFRDTVIVNPLFMPPVFKPEKIAPVNELIAHQTLTYNFGPDWEKSLFKPSKLFQKEMIRLQIQNIAYRHIQRHLPSVFHYSITDLPSEKVTFIESKEDIKIPVEIRLTNVSDITAPVKFIPDRKYWISSLESSFKFSENSTSDNWHSGPTKTTILNIFTRNIVKYNYAKDRIKIDNDLDLRLNFYNAPNDTIRKYKVSEDLLRLHTNFGVRAFKKWYYSFDVDFKTQLFSNYKENTMEKQAGLLSPYTVNLGLGMKFDHTQKYKRFDRSMVMSINLAPFAYTYMGALSDSINWGRHGFPKDDVTGLYKNYLSRFGSTVDFNMTYKPSLDITWKTRIKYFTSYDRVVAEFENSLDFAMGRFFSTLLFLNLRYDDGVTKPVENGSFIQWSQLISFGFNYKW